MFEATFVVAAFLAANMGLSGFAVAFTPSYGSRILKKQVAAVLFGLAVLAGGLLLGQKVAETLAHKISAGGFHGLSPFLIIISCAISMFTCSLLKVPQSTSFVTVSAFTGAAMYYGNVYWPTIIRILLVAAIFSALSFAITFWLTGLVYPPRPDRAGFYEFFMSRRRSLRGFIIGHDVYAAFSVGTNNVANVVAPLLGLAGIPLWGLFLVFGPMFGIGAFFAGERMLKSVSRDIIPVGEFSASVVSLVTATFVLIASLLGVPTPYAQFGTFALLGISCVKDGVAATMQKTIVQRILWVWLLVPLLTVGLSYGLHLIFMR